MTDDPLEALYGPLRHQSCDSCAGLRHNPRRCLIEHIEFYNNGYYCADHHPKTESPAK
jgi:hypothetical protein